MLTISAMWCEVGASVAQLLLGHDGYPHLENQVGDDRAEVGISRPLAVAVDATLQLTGTSSDRRQRGGHGAPAVVVEMDADLGLGKLGPHLSDHVDDLMGKGAAVGIAQHEPLRPAFHRRPGHRQRKPRVREYPSKKCSASKKTRRPRLRRNSTVSPAMAMASSRSVRRAWRTCSSHALPTMHTTSVSASSTARSCASALHRVPGLRVAPKATRVALRRPSSLGALAEELVVLGKGTGPSALDVVDPQLVEQRRDPQLVAHGERYPLLLRSVPQGGVVDLELGLHDSSAKKKPPACGRGLRCARRSGVRSGDDDGGVAFQSPWSMPRRGGRCQCARADGRRKTADGSNHPEGSSRCNFIRPDGRDPLRYGGSGGAPNSQRRAITRSLVSLVPSHASGERENET